VRFDTPETRQLGAGEADESDALVVAGDSEGSAAKGGGAEALAGAGAAKDDGASG